MKKIIAIVLSAGLFLSSQVAMAGALNGHVVLDQFESELNAVKTAQSIVEQIQAGSHEGVISVAHTRCQNVKKVKYSTNGFVVEPVWIDNENGFQKEYQARINYRFSCDMKDFTYGSIYN